MSTNTASATANTPSLSKFLTLVVQLALTLFVIYRFQLENNAFFYVFALTVGGFVVHYLLPLKLRLPFFLLLSLTGIGLIFGFKQAALLIGMGMALIGVCHLPLPMIARVAILVVIGAGLSVMRIGWYDAPWSHAILPVLGSMFMFRLINYLYDLHHKAAPVGFWKTTSYFFLLPNICFPLFPVVDYKTFIRNYYQGDRHEIYQIGATWVWRGVVQLLLYRYVYYYLTYDPVSVTDLGQLAGHMLSTFALYLKVSGQFHIIIGILHLFGFKLPETHHRYYLANSFTDFWRRINIYWKDFMLKLFYRPIYFRFRKAKGSTALIVATLLTFAATWCLHAYQWFWIQGSILIELHDILFWTILAFLVLFNALYEEKYGRERSIGTKAKTLQSSIKLVFSTIGTFSVICVLWSLWNSESLEDWWLLVTWAAVLPDWTTSQWAFGILAGAACIVLCILNVWKNWEGRLEVKPRFTPLMVIIPASLICLMSFPAINSKLGAGGEVIASLQAQHLNRRDAAKFQRGYYEDLLALSRNNWELEAVYAQAAPEAVRSLSKIGMARVTNDFLTYDLYPNKQGSFIGKKITTNEWGMRDKSYPKQRPDNSYRMALIGASMEMGTGVADGDNFESMTETLLNSKLKQTEFAGYEILNFAVGGYTPLHELYMFETRVFDFEPTTVIYGGHSVEKERMLRRLAKVIEYNEPNPYPELEEIVKRSGAETNDGKNVIRRRLLAHADEILAWSYKRIVKQCRDRNVKSVYLYVPGVAETVELWRVEDHDDVMQHARDAGFDIVIDLTGVFKADEVDKLWIADYDQHANADGNRLLADRLYQLLLEHDNELGLTKPTPIK